MGILIWIIFGALVGWVASMIMNGEGGLVWDIIVGIVGAVIGGFIVSMIGKSGVSGFNLYSFIVALLGACILVAIVKAVHYSSRCNLFSTKAGGVGEGEKISRHGFGR